MTGRMVAFLCQLRSILITIFKEEDFEFTTKIDSKRG